MIDIELCPRRWLTTFIGTPAASARRALVCRRSWNRILESGSGGEPEEQMSEVIRPEPISVLAGEDQPPFEPRLAPATWERLGLDRHCDVAPEATSVLAEGAEEAEFIEGR